MTDGLLSHTCVYVPVSRLRRSKPCKTALQVLSSSREKETTDCCLVGAIIPLSLLQGPFFWRNKLIGSFISRSTDDETRPIVDGYGDVFSKEIYDSWKEPPVTVFRIVSSEAAAVRRSHELLQ